MQWLTTDWLGPNNQAVRQDVRARLRSPGFPVELDGVGEPHAAFLTKSRTRSHGWSHAQEIRVGMTTGGEALSSGIR
jgi:hypothetical protein